MGEDFSEFEAFFLSLRLIGEPPLSGEVSDLDLDLVNTGLALQEKWIFQNFYVKYNHL